MFSSNASQVSDSATYIEDIFSCFLYTGNGSTQTINNGIDLAGEGGLVWIKSRSNAESHRLFDTVRGATKSLVTDTTLAENTNATTLTAFNSNGFSLGSDSTGNVNLNNLTYASWTFRKQPKFFDVVTYTGNDVAGRTVAHNLGSEPAVIIVKSTSAAGDWAVYHRSLGATKYTLLNSTAAAVTDSSYWQNTTPTSTEFTLGGAGRVNYGGRSYVAYLFAHNAGGFGESGEDNVISCGSYTGNGSTNGPTVTLGYEPQWVLIKNATTATTGWVMLDSMRGWVTNGTDNLLRAESSAAELTSNDYGQITATGFELNTANSYVNNSGSTMIYIAIRRGPMKTPTTGTSVFNISSRQATAPGFVSGFPVDMYFYRRTDAVVNTLLGDRLRGGNVLYTNLTDAESAAVNVKFDYMNGADSNSGVFATLYGWMFRRAPGFFDVVTFIGNGFTVSQNIAHSLGVTPELIIVKDRNRISGWPVFHSALGTTGSLYLNTTAAKSNNGNFPALPTSTYFNTGRQATNDANVSSGLYVAYLFASCPGVSKVGSYTGNGSSQTINCGFTAGARFVLVKATSTTGDWLVADSARGIVSGNDPYLELNTTNAEVTGEDWLDTDSSGFVVNEVSGSNANTNGVTYIYLAIA